MDLPAALAIRPDPADLKQGRLIEVTQPGGGASGYGVSSYAQVAYGAGGSGGITRYSYDELDRLLQVTFPGGETIRYDYDLGGRLWRLTDVHLRETKYTYLDDDRLETVDFGGRVFTYQYRADGLLEHLVYPTPTDVVADYDWDERGRLKQIHYRRNQERLLTLRYCYDPSGNRSHIIETSSSGEVTTREYHYDRLNRLERVYRNKLIFSQYGYDESDNRRVMDRWTIPGEPQRDLYDYDAADQILSVKRSNEKLLAFKHDLDGNLEQRDIHSTGETVKYRWSDLDELVGIESSIHGRVMVNEYDAAGVRGKRTGADGTVRKSFYVGLPTVSEQVQAPGAPDAYSYILEQQLIGFEKNGDAFYYATDHLSSVRLILDQTGGVASFFAFDEFGLRPGNGGASSKTFVGGLSVHDEVNPLGLLYMHHRWYDPSLGRFLSADPFDSLGNPYVYAANQPIDRVDPAGLISWTVAPAYIAALVVVAGVYVTIRVSNEHRAKGYRGWPRDLRNAFYAAKGLPGVDPHELQEVLAFYQRVYPGITSIHCERAQDRLLKRLKREFPEPRTFYFRKAYIENRVVGDVSTNPLNVIEIAPRLPVGDDYNAIYLYAASNPIEPIITDKPGYPLEL